MTSTNDYSQRIEQLHQLITDADYVLIGAGAGLSAAAGLDYAGEDFRQEFSEWINRYGITDLYSASFYPFKTEEELPHTPDCRPVSMNLRCDDTFVEDAHWHKQVRGYQEFVEQANAHRMLLLELGVGFNTPVIIRFPFERMAAQFPQTTLVRFNRDYPQLTTQGVNNYMAFTEDLTEMMHRLFHK